MRCWEMEGTNLRTQSRGEVEHSVLFERGKVEEVEMIGDLEILVARKVEEFGQIVLGGVSVRFGICVDVFWRSFWSST